MSPGAVLDVQALQSPRHAERGIGRYVAGHATALLGHGTDVRACLLNPLLAAPAALPTPIRPYVRWNTRSTLRELASADGPLLYHVMSPFEDVRPGDALVTPHGVRGADAVVVTLYDAIPYVLAEHYQRSWWNRQFLRRRARLLHAADLVLAISEASARDAVDVLGLDPARIVVIGAAADPAFRRAQPGDDPDAHLRRAVPAVTRPFVLSVSGDDPRKDPMLLVDAFGALPPELRRAHQLVVVCTLTSEAEAAWRTHASSRGLGPDDVVFTGYVPDDLLRALYQQARLFAYTSRYEGFGLPVLEAAACGCPAITSDSSSLPEVLDCVASQAPAGDVEAVAGLMERALTDDELRRELVAAGDRAVSRHTWASVAARTQTAYGQLAERCDERMRPLRRATVQRFRVAAVGPFPPAASGVAYYNARVFTELAARCDVDCFSENDGAPADRIAGARTFPIDAFGRAFSPAGYDAVVYVLGNSRFHIRTLELARRYPGVCWLHDASLAGVYLTTAGLYLPGVPPERIDFDAAREFMRARLHDCMGPQAPDLGERWWQPEAYVEAGALMTEILLRQARRVVVSTDAAVALVKPRAPAGLPVDVVPLAVCDPHVARTATPHDEPWIVSLGIVSEVKQVELLVEAVASVRETRPVRLALVGNVDPDYAQQLAARAATLGLGDALEVTGFVTDGAYWSWAARATLIVQLRSRSVGEGSAAVADAIALGTPVLTNVGAAHELPSGVVELLPADATAADVAAAIVTLLDDDRRRHALETAAAAYARANHFGAVAERVLALLRDTAERRFPEPLLLEPLASGVPA